MSNAKLTSGTWRYEPQFSAIVTLVGHELKAVADFGKCDLPETEANAVLMAASKEMLAALEAARTELESCIDCMNDIDDCRRARLSIGQIDAAIAKAKG